MQCVGVGVAMTATPKTKALQSCLNMLDEMRARLNHAGALGERERGFVRNLETQLTRNLIKEKVNASISQ